MERHGWAEARGSGGAKEEKPSVSLRASLRRTRYLHSRLLLDLINNSWRAPAEKKTGICERGTNECLGFKRGDKLRR